MKDPRSQTDSPSARRAQRGERAKRGLIAGYIHAISARHASAAVVPKERRRPAS
jgi:hypothetical protein